MTVRLSSGLKDALVSNYGLGAMFVGGEFQIYTGVQPASADAPPGAEMVGRIVSATADWQPMGLRFVLSPDFGVIQTDPSLNTLLLATVIDKPLVWVRLVQAGDAGEQSVLAPRLDFAVDDAVIADMPQTFTEQATYQVSSLKLKFS